MRRGLEYFFSAVILGAFLIGVFAGSLSVFDLTFREGVYLGAGLVIFYSVFLFFIVEKRIHIHFQEIEKIVEKPIMQEVIVEKPVEIFKEVVREIDRPIYITNPRKKLDIPKYEYVGSNEEMRYHKRTCRFSKLIKKKYRVNNNDEKYFIRHGYIACKSCIKKKK